MSDRSSGNRKETSTGDLRSPRTQDMQKATPDSEGEDRRETCLDRLAKKLFGGKHVTSDS